MTGNAGSFFKNPVVGREEAERLSALYPDMPHYPAADPSQVKLAAGWLIDRAGLKGHSEGRVGIHPRQALVIINLGGATGTEIVAFARKVQEQVKENASAWRSNPKSIYYKNHKALPMNLLDNFQRYIRRNELAAPEDFILLTVSGGVDSMVMLSLFVRSGYRVGVAHCNFQLRGVESEEDEELVRREAEKYGVPWYNKRFDTKGEMERTGESMEMAARRLRYAWFDELSREHGYTVVAIAHHIDDSIETFFINLLRGTGLRGLTGITTHAGKLIRPLMFASRKDILEYAVAQHILPGRFVEPLDQIPAQQDPPGTRTPHQGDQPQVHRPDASEHRPSDRRAALHQPRHPAHPRRGHHHRKRDRHDPHRPYRPGFPAEFRNLRTAQLDLFVQRRRVGRSGQGAGAELRHGQAVLLQIPRGVHRQGTDYGNPDPGGRPLPGAGRGGRPRCYCGNSVLYFELRDIDDIQGFGVPEHIAQVDADKLKYPLTVRRWQEGDWFIPYGMSGRKKVSDYLIDHKVPLPEKARQFVLLSGDEIVWLVGRRIDDRYRLTAETENVLRITKEII